MSTITCDTPRSALDETAWRAVCKTAAEHAQRGCGLSWDHWVTLFSSEIDAQASRLPESQRVHALEIATQEWDYATPAERQETQDWLAENGCCSHGITLGCCPAGCGSQPALHSIAAHAAFHHPLGVLPHGEASGSTSSGGLSWAGISLPNRGLN